MLDLVALSFLDLGAHGVWELTILTTDFLIIDWCVETCDNAPPCFFLHRITVTLRRVTYSRKTGYLRY